jgi:hypothetical protein
MIIFQNQTYKSNVKFYIKKNHIYSKNINKEHVSKSNNLKNILLKISFLWKTFLWQNDNSPLKQNKHIGSFSLDHTIIVKRMNPTWYIHNKADICFDKESFIDYQPF